ncbi:MAG TPA: protoheme IX farnesyltransferase, partial [Beijerinckiaceae bacterium]|nr:protoheme IX farnesyltransferase [Beijerinckiaceae bacterium]
LVLAPVGALPYFLGFASPFYGVVAALGGGAMVAAAARVYLRRDGKAADRAAMQLFGLSILYLFTLFGVLVVERCIAMWIA